MYANGNTLWGYVSTKKKRNLEKLKIQWNNTLISGTETIRTLLGSKRTKMREQVTT